MPYTLAMFFLWGMGMALIGVVIGWLLRSLRRRAPEGSGRSTAGEQPEVADLRRRVAELEGVVQERDRLRMELADVRGSSVGELGFAPAALDLDAAAATFGHDVALDDLTVVVGIGPKTVELCSGMGVTTWRQLAATEPAMLQTMLDDGGSHFKNQDPSSWPRQAALLADGRWEEFKALSDDLGSGG